MDFNNVVFYVSVIGSSFCLLVMFLDNAKRRVDRKYQKRQDTPE